MLTGTSYQTPAGISKIESVADGVRCAERTCIEEPRGRIEAVMERSAGFYGGSSRTGTKLGTLGRGAVDRSRTGISERNWTSTLNGDNTRQDPAAQSRLQQPGT